MNSKKTEAIMEGLNVTIDKAKNLIKKTFSKGDGCANGEEPLVEENPGLGISNKNLAEQLTTLLQMDTDAVAIYENVIEGIKDDKNITDELASFKNDHLRHIDKLMQWLPVPPKKITEVKRIVWTAYVKLRGSICGTEGFLKALLTSERMIWQYYSETAKINFLDENLKQAVIDNFDDEKRHIEYIEQQLSKAKE